MKKKKTEVEEVVNEVENGDANRYTDLCSEIVYSDDFILTYIKCLAIINGGRINLDEMREQYGWKLPKVQALSAAINHFCARGMLKRGANSKEVFLNK